MSCAACGRPTLEGAAFCGSCGAALAPAPSLVTGSGPTLFADSGESARSSEPSEPSSEKSAPSPEPAEAEPAKTQHLAPGTVVDKKYAIVRVLGAGGMGVVYLARDIHTGLDVVVKAVRPELAHRDDVRKRTLAEGRALAQIDHPNVVHLKSVVADGASLWLVMQFIDGESLDRTIARNVERREPMPIGAALAIFRQIVAGVGAAHAEGVIHRDLKPANVIVRRKDGVAKVTDFGIAKVEQDTSREHTKGIIGSLWYMSPEQVTGRRDLDRRVDVYSLGILLYQMLVGRVPFDADSDYEIMKMHAESPMPLAAAGRADVPAAVDALIQKACTKDRQRRFQSCDELIAAIDRAASGVRDDPAPRGAYGWGATEISPASLGPRSPASMPHPRASLHEGAPPERRSIVGAPPAVDPRPEGTTGQGAALPAAPRGTGRWVFAGLAAFAIAGGGAALYATGVLPGNPPRPHAGSGTTEPADAGASDASSASTARGTPSDGGVDALAGLRALEGRWVNTDNGHQLDAVGVDDELEFRVRSAAQFFPQDYRDGEARFVLRPTAEAGVFAVEDRIRPLPPPGKTYDPRSRSTCQEVWTSAGSTPLRARWDGTRLSVEVAKIEPTEHNFVVEGAKVTSCRALRDLKAARVISMLTRT